MKNKKLVRWVALLLLVVAVVGVTFAGAKEPAAKAAGLSLEDMPIVLPAQATDVEKTAAKELQHYLKEMTGTNSSILTEGVQVESAIYLGATKFAKENNVTYTDNNGQGEGWAIKAIGSNVVLTGGETRGTLYAVYHLLEDHFGVHWWNVWEEYVPTMEDAVVPFDYDHSGEPLFADRAIYFSETKTSLYYVRNRMNGFTANAPAAYGGEINYAKPYHVHTFNRMFPAYYAEPTSASAAAWTDAINPEGISWFEEHPEWFAYSRARGERISYGQMCLTNKELMQEFGNKAIKAIELSYKEADEQGVARPSYIDVSPNDMAGHCECDECIAVEAASGPSGRLLKFVNAVAEVVETVYPEMKVETLAYDDYFELPLDGTKPRHNVVIRLASSDVDIVHDMDHPNNAKVKKRLYEWGNLLDDGQLMYWDYGIVLGDYGVLPNMFKFGRDYRQVYENGGVGVFTEFQRCNTVDFWDMKHWILTKVIEDPYQDEKELAMTFLNGYYGEAAAEPLLNYLYFMEDAAADHYEIITFSDKLMEAPWLSAEDILKGNAYFEEAIAALKADTSLSEADRELFLNRVAAARGGLDRLILANYTDYVMEMYEAGKNFGLDRQEVGKRMVAGLTWLMAMENEVDYTGIDNWGVRKDTRGQNALSAHSKYAAETDSVTGEAIERPAIPEQIYEDHPGISDVHIHDYLADSMFQAGIYVQYPYVDKVSHAASWGGTAIVVDYKELFDWAEYSGSGYNSYLFSETKPLTTNLGSLLLNKPLVADGEYHLYRIPDHVVLREGKTLVSFFNDVIRFDVKNLEWLADDPVDVYVSMKIEGDPTSATTKNPAKLYIERVLIVEPCYAYDINYNQEIPATCAKGTTMVGTCPVCGKEAEKEIAGTKLSHTMVSDYVYDAATNTYKGECAHCGEVEYQFEAELPENVLADLKEANLGLERVHEFTVGDFTVSNSSYLSVVDDPDSAMSGSVFWDLNKMSNYGHFEITNNKPFWDWDNKIPSDLYADDFIADGQYHTYRLQNVSLITEDSQEFIFFNWSLRVPMPKLAYLEGRKVDVYFSMKIDGELDFSDPSNLPDYYVDRVLVVETCPEHAADEYTYNEQTGVYEGQCRNCGKVVSYKFRAKLPQRVVDDMNAEGNDPQHIHDFGPSDFRQSSKILSFVDDPESPYGRAAMLNVSKYSKPSIFVNPSNAVRSVGLSAKGEIASLDLDEMIEASKAGGYHTYKLDDLVMPEVGKGYGYFHFGYSYFQSYNVAYKLGELAGKTVDIYISMKIDKPLGNSSQIPNYYVDRVIVVDNCGNHLNEDSRELISTGTCYEGNIYSARCEICGRTVKTEDPSTRLPHNFGEYVTSADGKSQVAKCQNANCPVTKVVSLEAALPQEVLDDLNANGIDPTHVYDFAASQFRTGTTSLLSFVDDPDSPYGRAAKIDTTKSSNAGPLISLTEAVRTVGLQSKGKLGVLDKDDLVAGNKAGGYHAYKLENVTIPEGKGFGYFYLLNYYIQSYNVSYKLEEFAGKTVDIYISMKIDGEIDNYNKAKYPIYYVDRIIIVTDCEDFDLTFVETPGEDCTTPGISTALCPHCGKEVTKEGSTATHSFTQYFRDTLDMYKYVAKCDRGCGATDVKYDQRLSVQEKLPAELPDSVKKHVLFSYSCDEFILSGPEDPYMWDLELDRPVGVLDYNRNYESSSMVYTGNTGPIACMYPSGAPSHGLGEFKGVAANSGKGYQLYSIKNVIPIKERAYNYFYMFSSWVLQIHMLDDDLIKNDYRGKAVDLYLYMKAEGDTSCVTEDKPTYWIDQIIVAESCTTDDTWEVVREATCSQTGLMKGNCSVCGLQGAEVEIPMIPHVMTRTVLEKNATCYANEVRYGLCDICGARESQQVEGTMLEHSFSNYVKQNDGTEIAYCDNGCGERHIRNSVSYGENIQLPEPLQPIIPILGGAAGGSSFGFSDIKESDWYFENVKEAWENKLIDGVTSTEFRPNETLTVAQAVKLAAAYHEMNYTGDVTLENGSGNWYSSYVDYAVENGIIDRGYASKSTAEMNKAIDRSEFVSIFVKAMDEGSLVGYNDVADNAIPDVKTDDENADAIYKFYRAGILTGSDGKGTFNPTSSIKRSEVAAILSRMYNENVRQAITLK